MCTLNPCLLLEYRYTLPFPRLESRLAGQKIQAIEELIGIVKDSGKLHFNNKLSLFSSFKVREYDDN